MTSHNPKLVIFDCDGTLVDSENINAAAWSEHMTNFGVPLSHEEAYSRLKGLGMDECVAIVARLSGKPIPAEFVPNLRIIMNRLIRDSLQPIRGALELVKSMSVPFCVASNAPREKIELCLKVTGLLPYFQGAIFSAHDVKSWKPDPGLFLHAAATMGFTPTECVVVEDSLPGINAGLAAQMHVLALEPDEENHGFPEQATLVKDLAEVSALISGMIGKNLI